MNRPLLLYPFIFAIHPIMFLYIHNLKNATIPIISLVSCLVFFLTLSIILYLLFRKIIKERLKTGLFLTVFIIFYVYILFWYPILLYAVSYLFHINKVTYLIFIISFLALVLLFIISIAILRTGKKLNTITEILNYFSVCLIVTTLAIGLVEWYNQSNLKIHNEEQTSKIDKSQIKTLPNIFYIIMDAYADEQILKNMYGYNNREFLNFLENKGFFIAPNGRSNYPLTIHSLASSLNLNYIHEIALEGGRNSLDKRPLMRMLRENKVRKFLSAYGYKFIAFASGSYQTEIKDADLYVNPVKYDLFFENLVFSKTLLKPLFGRLTASYQIQNHKKRILENFERIPGIARDNSPCFVFAHFLCPHPPFVFGETEFYSLRGDIVADGNLLHDNDKVLQKKYIAAYNEQIGFINQKVIKLIQDIFSQSITPPIIILQADHGPRLGTDFSNYNNTNWREILSILNAIHFPGKKNALYEGITPVNTFRLLLNEYFSTKYPILPDRMFILFGNEHNRRVKFEQQD